MHHRNLNYKIVILVFLLVTVTLLATGFFYLKLSNCDTKTLDKQFSPSDGIPVLMYHKVSPSYKAGGLGLRVRPKDFAWQMQYLYNNRYHTVSLEDVVDYWQHKKSLPSNPVVITFDDGYEDNYKYAYPILKKYHFTATIFVVVNSVGKTNFFDVRRGVQPVNKMLTWAEIKELDANGITIGAHTMNHPHLAKIKPYQAEREIIESKKALEKALGKPVLTFSYPYGSYNKTVEDFVKKAGFKVAVTTKQGINFSNADPYALKRIRIMGRYSHRKFIHELTRYYKKN